MSLAYHVRIRTLSPCLATLGLLAVIAAGCDPAPEIVAPAILPADAFMAQMTKVDVCHRNADGQFVKISIADAAYSTHIAHGDGSVGGAVPGAPGYEFDAECQPQEVQASECPCFSATRVAESTAGSSPYGDVILSDVDYEGGFYETTLSVSDPAFGALPLFEAQHPERYSPSCRDIQAEVNMSVTSEEAAMCRSILLEYDS